jgi:UDP:flavonoid glycosyltransferase YjiC (YdhE family)
MGRFLFVFPPLVGHVNPATGIADELRRRGHEVAWVVHEAAVGHLLGGGAKVYSAGDDFLETAVELLTQYDQLKGAASLRFAWEDFLVPLAESMAEPVRAAVDDLRPDVVVSDQHAFAGALVATERGLPWAVSACSTAELLDPLLAAPTKIRAWIESQLHGLYLRLSLPQLVGDGFDPRYSPHLTIEYSSAELVGPVQRDLSTVAFVGPVLPRTGDPGSFPWEWLDRYETRVLVHLGTLTQQKGLRFLRRVMEAADGQPYGMVMVGEASLLPEPPDNVLVCPFVPQLDLLPRLDAVVCHAGHNTVVGALSFGVPLVCAPITLDQPITTGQVVRAGAGRKVSFARATSAEVREAIDAVLHDPSYRAAAGRIGASLRAAGGAATAADRLEALRRDAPRREAVSPRPGGR